MFLHNTGFRMFCRTGIPPNGKSAPQTKVDPPKHLFTAQECLLVPLQLAPPQPRHATQAPRYPFICVIGEVGPLPLFYGPNLAISAPTKPDHGLGKPSWLGQTSPGGGGHAKREGFRTGQLAKRANKEIKRRMGFSASEANQMKTLSSIRFILQVITPACPPSIPDRGWHKRTLGATANANH